MKETSERLGFFLSFFYRALNLRQTCERVLHIQNYFIMSCFRKEFPAISKKPG